MHTNKQMYYPRTTKVTQCEQTKVVQA